MLIHNTRPYYTATTQQLARIQSVAFSPIQVSSFSEWYDYRHSSVMAVGDGNPITTWTGATNTRALRQTGSLCPTYVINDGDGKPAVRFDGIDDVISGTYTNSSLFGTTGDYEIWLVARASSAGDFFNCAGANNYIGLASLNTSGGTLYMSKTLNAVSYTGNLQDNTWNVIRCVKNGAQRILQKNGTTIYDSTTSAGLYGTGLDTMKIGYGANHITGAFRHWLCFKSPLDDATAALVNTYLSTN